MKYLCQLRRRGERNAPTLIYPATLLALLDLADDVDALAKSPERPHTPAWGEQLEDVYAAARRLWEVSS